MGHRSLAAGQKESRHVGYFLYAEYHGITSLLPSIGMPFGGGLSPWSLFSQDGLGEDSVFQTKGKIHAHPPFSIRLVDRYSTGPLFYRCHSIGAPSASFDIPDLNASLS